jgi:uncharacterized membrane protein
VFVSIDLYAKLCAISSSSLVYCCVLLPVALSCALALVLLNWYLNPLDIRAAAVVAAAPIALNQLFCDARASLDIFLLQLLLTDCPFAQWHKEPDHSSLRD